MGSRRFPGAGYRVNALATSSKNASLRLVFLGDDEEGIALEVMAVELEDDALLVIHAMPLRDRYRKQYEEARKWRR